MDDADDGNTHTNLYEEPEIPAGGSHKQGADSSERNDSRQACQLICKDGNGGNDDEPGEVSCAEREEGSCGLMVF